MALVNSKLLEVFNITKDTTDPINGKYIEKKTDLLPDIARSGNDTDIGENL